MLNTLPTPLHRTGNDPHIHNRKRLLPGLALVATCPRCDVPTLAIVADCQGALHWRRSTVQDDTVNYFGDEREAWIYTPSTPQTISSFSQMSPRTNKQILLRFFNDSGR
jgi:hypothetical protein